MAQVKSLQQPVVILGLGEIGGVFARGFLRAGHPVYPLLRGMDVETVRAHCNDPELVLNAVGEADLHTSVQSVPDAWRDRLGLLQNELLPQDWQGHGIEEPTVAVLWFEKKPGMDAKVLLPSPLYGPHARLLADSLEAVNIPVRILEGAEDLEYELVRKNLYILTTNIAGIVAGGTVEGLWEEHRELAEAVADEILKIQSHLVGHDLDRERLLAGMVEAFEADPEHKCTGRSAPARLERALENAEAAGFEASKLREIFEVAY